MIEALTVLGWIWTIGFLVVAAAVIWKLTAAERDREANREDFYRRREEREASYRTNRGRVMRMDEMRAQARCAPATRLEGKGTVRNINEGDAA